MEHIKIDHIQFVARCKNEKTECRYGPNKCWFTHKENIENAYNQAKNENIPI